jgi:predicted ATP-dependent endonuclease of OLD family
MHYTKFAIKNFRCFENEQTLYFAQPKSDKIGSGITYIVGANNSGKTTLIESLWMRNGVTLNDSERKGEKPTEFKLFNDGNVVRTIKLLRNSSNIFTEEPVRSHDDDLFEFISSRRHWGCEAEGSGFTLNIIKNSSAGNIRPRQQQNIQTALFLREIENSSEYEKFTQLIKSIIPEFTNWRVAFEDKHYIKYISNNKISHKTDFLGDGVISIIRILAHLFMESPTGLIIDEPELSLHPLAQKRLIKIIAEYAKKRQIVISTHSPYFVSWEYIKNGAVINRVSKDNDVNSTIYTVKDFEKYVKLLNGGNWQQPYLMDVVSKEIFFQEDILFVEGQEDVGLLQPYFAGFENINFFGYGVRGYNNFEFALELAQDLGIKKACVLIDSPSDITIKNNENEVRQKLELKYGEKYKIIQWEKTDIRDKPIPEKTPAAKVGYFNEGKLKEENELGDFYEKIEKIKDYFKTQEPINLLKAFTSAIGFETDWEITDDKAWCYINNDNIQLLEQYNIDPVVMEKIKDERHILSIEEVSKQNLENLRPIPKS